MPKPIKHLIESTNSGVKIGIKAIYMYPDGHGNIVFDNDTAWPLADPLEFTAALAGDLLSVLLKESRRRHPQGARCEAMLLTNGLGHVRCSRPGYLIRDDHHFCGQHAPLWDQGTSMTLVGDSK